MSLTTWTTLKSHLHSTLVLYTLCSLFHADLCVTSEVFLCLLFWIHCINILIGYLFITHNEGGVPMKKILKKVSLLGSVNIYFDTIISSFVSFWNPHFPFCLKMFCIFHILTFIEIFPKPINLCFPFFYNNFVLFYLLLLKQKLVYQHVTSCH
jgi:hypothetical protein